MVARRQATGLVLALAWLLASACAGRPSVGPERRQYWPTTGWRATAPAAQGMGAKILAGIDSGVADRYPQVHSLLVVRHGYLVYERYWHGHNATTGESVFSTTKNVNSALVGIALHDGRIKTVNQTVGELLAPHLPPAMDPRMRNVTVEQLLTMTAGMPGNGGANAAMTTELENSPDWVRYILGQPLATEPGTTFAYSNASSHLLSAIVADATGQSTLAFARARLFGPLGIHTERAVEPVANGHPDPASVQAYDQASVGWPKDPQGYHVGYSYLRLPARDLAKFGYLYLNGGRWDKTQVIPAEYVRASTERHSVPPRSEQYQSYGYQWWLSAEKGHRAFLALGSGGQIVEVIPDLDLVVVITADVDQGRYDAQFLIEQSIVPAVTD